MNRPIHMQLVLSIYAAMLRVFPTRFRAEFEGEMRAIFYQAACDAADQGLPTLFRFFLHELVDLPFGALQEHAQEWRGRGQGTLAAEQYTPYEMLIALAVFLIPAGFIMLKSAPSSFVAEVIPPAMLFLLVVGSVVGSLKRFPRWSLPYFGLILSAIVFLLLFQWEAERVAMLLASRFVYQPSDELGRLLLVASWEGVIWLSLLMLVAFFIILLAFWPRFRPLIQRLHEDWTQLSYLLYGSATLALVLAFDGYPHQEPYALTGLFVMAVGAWGYLRSHRRGWGFLALLAGVTFSMAVAVMGKWLFTPGPVATGGVVLNFSDPERWFETESLMIVWAWLVVVIALPGLLKRLAGRFMVREFA